MSTDTPSDLNRALAAKLKEHFPRACKHGVPSPFGAYIEVIGDSVVLRRDKYIVGDRLGETSIPPDEFLSRRIHYIVYEFSQKEEELLAPEQTKEAQEQLIKSWNLPAPKEEPCD